MRVRAERMALQIQRDVSDIIRSEVKDPRIGFLTVTGVDISNDLTHAKIFVSILGDPDQRRESFAVLERTKGFIRSEIGRRIRLRQTPEIVFKLDETAAYSERIGRVLNGLGVSGAGDGRGTGAGEDENNGPGAL